VSHYIIVRVNFDTRVCDFGIVYDTDPEILQRDSQRHSRWEQVNRTASDDDNGDGGDKLLGGENNRRDDFGRGGAVMIRTKSRERPKVFPFGKMPGSSAKGAMSNTNPTFSECGKKASRKKGGKKIFLSTQW
jgi:hypothetical protein